eukprot:GILI01046870.1.p1 GENE.GILI01046870.1~~GILI01046870.1.p1  ORF type:complete len:280 (-),score=77.05 GILI01046870.1:12-851(-)
MTSETSSVAVAPLSVSLPASDASPSSQTASSQHLPHNVTAPDASARTASPASQLPYSIPLLTNALLSSLSSSTPSAKTSPPSLPPAASLAHQVDPTLGTKRRRDQLPPTSGLPPSIEEAAIKRPKVVRPILPNMTNTVLEGMSLPSIDSLSSTVLLSQLTELLSRGNASGLLLTDAAAAAGQNADDIAAYALQLRLASEVQSLASRPVEEEEKRASSAASSRAVTPSASSVQMPHEKKSVEGVDKKTIPTLPVSAPPPCWFCSPPSSLFLFHQASSSSS